MALQNKQKPKIDRSQEIQDVKNLDKFGSAEYDVVQNNEPSMLSNSNNQLFK